MASVQVAGVMIESDGKGSRVAERSLGTRGQKSRHEGRCLASFRTLDANRKSERMRQASFGSPARDSDL